jgi:hypothetical protein
MSKSIHGDIKDKVIKNYKEKLTTLTIKLYGRRTYERKTLTENLSSVKRYCLINFFSPKGGEY